VVDNRPARAITGKSLIEGLPISTGPGRSLRVTVGRSGGAN
jgi:hypothetical protein